MVDDRAVEAKVLELGRSIFSSLHHDEAPLLSAEFWISLVMEWSMRDPQFKLNLFRLVDVLPSLRSEAALSHHISEYLAPTLEQWHPFLGWCMRASPHSPRGAVIRFAVRTSVLMLAHRFIAGATPHEALPKLSELRRQRLAFTIDLLGEFSVSEAEAEIYLQRYLEALKVLSEGLGGCEPQVLIPGHPGERSLLCLSVKLTALYSQCGPLNFERSVAILSERFSIIARAARKVNAALYIDAEDCANNPIIFATYMRVFSSAEFADFPYPGIVVQAYVKDSEQTVNTLLSFARTRGSPISIRLVKGAYWDYEYVASRQMGHPTPLFTNKSSCDAHYEKLTRLLLEHRKHCLPAIASHNIRSLSYACSIAASLGAEPREFELQMLYGMAEPIAKVFSSRGYLTRLYVPLGDMFVGMGYLVRRLLENTSNESFLRHTFFEGAAVDRLLQKPVPVVT